MKYRFCPKCSGKLSRVLDKDEYRLICSNCGFIFYQNPKPTASAIITNSKNEVLLVKRKAQPSKGKWDVPGGFLELGEHPEAGLRREMKEELGVKIKIIKLLGIFMDTYGSEKYSTLNISYLAKIKRGNPRVADKDENYDLKWFSKNRLPKNLAFKNNREMLNAWKKL